MTAEEPARSLPARLLIDLRPLRESPEFRRLWAGQVLSAVGAQMTVVAVPVHVYLLTSSSLAVGMVGLAVAIPMVLLGLLGGAIADAMDRRRLVLITSSLLAVLSVALAAQAVLDVGRVWVLYALVAAQSAVFAIDGPARRTFVPRLLPVGQLPAAAALSQLSFQMSLVAGPVLAGVVIALAGLQAAYLLDAVTFVLAMYGVARLRPMPPEGGARSAGLRSVAEGLRYLGRRPVLGGAFLADLNATVLAMPHALFPALATTRFGGGPATVGLLYAAPAVGGLIATALSGPFRHISRQGRAMLLAVAGWGLAVAAFGASPQLEVALIFLALAGMADVATVILRTTMVQVLTPDPLLGRVNGVDFVVGAGAPRLGDVRAGAVAALTSPAISAVTGGLACVAGVVLLRTALPALARYDAAAEGRPDRKP